MRTNVSSIGRALARHPFRTAAVSALAITAGLVIPAIVPELVRFFRIRRM